MIETTPIVGANPSPLDETNFRVLIVDDDATILSLLRDLVSMIPGVSVFSASKAEDAMKIAVAEKIDIVFTDVHMPGVTGIEMIKDFIHLQKTPEVIVMTAFPSGEIATEAMELGASAMLSKPFEDISVVETELDKAIKKILRQRAASESVEKRKAELKSTAKEVDNDPVMKVSLGAPKELPAIQTVTAPIPLPKFFEKKMYDQTHLAPMIEVEIQRCIRTKRQFAFGLIEIPENTQMEGYEDRKRYRDERIKAVQNCFRNSDVVFHFEGDSIAVVAFECNRTGVGVLEFKLAQAGCDFSGFAVFPSDGAKYEDLVDNARRAVINKRKFKIVMIEPEEFFGRIVHNMLGDPRYSVTWARTYKDAYREIQQNSEHVKLGIISLSQDSNQWKLLAQMKAEGLIQFPMILFTEVALQDQLKSQLQALGVRAIVRKGAGHEEFLYVVQSFVMQNSAIVARKNPRALVTVPLVYRTDVTEVSSNTFTLSREGVFIRELNPLPPGTKLSMELFVQGIDKPVVAKGEVIYAVPYFVGVNRIHVPGMAIRFTEIEEAARNQLDLFISNTLTSYLIG